MRTMIAAFAALALASAASAQMTTATPTKPVAPARPMMTHSIAPRPMAGPAKPMASTASMSAKGPAAPKTAISKACSAQADAKNLHGKDREKFRNACKRTG